MAHGQGEIRYDEIEMSPMLDMEDAPASAKGSQVKRVAAIAGSLCVVVAVCGLVAPSRAKGLMTRITGYDFVNEMDFVCDGKTYTVSPTDTIQGQELCQDIINGAGEKQCTLTCTPSNPAMCNYINKYANAVGVDISKNNFECNGAVTCDNNGGKNNLNFHSEDCQGLSVGAACFPGEATVQIEGVGQSRISDLHVGDRVLSAKGYETVLGFLHQLRGGSSRFLIVSHSDGEFRATMNHLVFAEGGSKAVGDLRVGELIFVSPSAPASQILEVREGKTSFGMFSPLTASGTVVVDGVIASIYGQPSMHLKLPHELAHAAFFPVRAYHALGLTRVFGDFEKDELHPFAELLYPLRFLLRK